MRVSAVPAPRPPGPSLVPPSPSGCRGACVAKLQSLPSSRQGAGWTCGAIAPVSAPVAGSGRGGGSHARASWRGVRDCPGESGPRAPPGGTRRRCRTTACGDRCPARPLGVQVGLFSGKVRSRLGRAPCRALPWPESRFWASPGDACGWAAQPPGTETAQVPAADRGCVDAPSTPSSTWKLPGPGPGPALPSRTWALTPRPGPRRLLGTSLRRTPLQPWPGHGKPPRWENQGGRTFQKAPSTKQKTDGRNKPTKPRTHTSLWGGSSACGRRVAWRVRGTLSVLSGLRLLCI